MADVGPDDPVAQEHQRSLMDLCLHIPFPHIITYLTVTFLVHVMRRSGARVGEDGHSEAHRSTYARKAPSANLEPAPGLVFDRLLSRSISKVLYFLIRRGAGQRLF